ncbi:longitudinals lacking protein, isoforms F/I/K/T isoform X2 [Frankliniella occidentalis]|uniref:Longitudinals lacking protein, isoforms F/I/K/T isoform X2 n=1 Tax=Frankliniella occidentalis TaxID=133901 RepID=A0A6J1S1Z8_FRAOC|nr:longitudinals lacking protein, isoforms F/I/K/T isoform X2 [Frankliniella occidentalis]
MGGTRFMVQWEEHPSHLATRLGQLLEHQTLVDVTLMCNTHTLRVHRAVLAACSPYFESILQRQLGAHPLIVLKDMQFSVLKSLIEFMYCGETSVTEDNLGALLQAAKFFQVKGLSSMTREALGLPASPAKPAPTPTPVPFNGDFAKKVPQVRTPASAKKIGMQTTLVSTAEVLNKQLIAGNTTTTTTASSALSQTRIADSTAVKVSTAQGVSTISTDTAQLLLNLSGAEGTLPQSVSTVDTPPVQVITRGVATTASTPSRPMLQMSSRNVRVSNLRGSNMMKIDAKSLAEKSKLADAAAGASPGDDAPRRRGRPLKKQINVMFQEKVISDAEVALQKEADASRLALEALKREMNTGDPGNAAAVEAELVEADETRSQEQIDDMVLKNEEELTEEMTGTHTLVASEDGSQQSEASTAEVVYQVTADGQVVATTAAGTDANSAGNVASYMEALKEAGLPTDLPILLDSGDGSYVTVNEEVLMNICNGGVIHYQVAEGNLVQGTDGQVVVQEGENENENENETETVQEFLQEDPEQPKETTKTSQASVIQMAAETKPVGKRNRVVTPSGGCGFTTARQIVKASMDKYRQEQAGVRKFVVKEMQAAELILEPGDEGVTLSQDEQHIVLEEGHDGIPEGHEQVEDEDQQQMVSTTTVEQTLVQTGGQVQALLQTFSEDGESQQEMVYLVTENADEVIASGNFGDGNHSFVVTDGTTVEGGHTFSIADGNIVVQQGQEEAEMSVEQALEAMMGGSDTSNHDTPNSNQQSSVDADSMRLVLGDPDDKSNVLLGSSSGDKTEDTLAILTDNAKLEDTLLDDLNDDDDDDENPSKDIPLAVGLLPLRTALERIQATPEHQPRKTRSSSLTGEGNKGGKRKSDSESENLEKKARSEEPVDSDGITDRFDVEEENSSSYDVETSLGVITEDGLKNVP